MRRVWRRRPIDVRRMARRGAADLRYQVDRARDLVRPAMPAMPTPALLRTAQGQAVEPHTHTIDSHPPTPRRKRGIVALAVVLGAALGALGMFYFDAHSGRRRRARVRDRLSHAGRIFRRDVPRTIERKGRFFGGVARGVRHDAAEMLPLHMRRQQPVDDETLVARVRSEAFRDGRIKAGELHVDAYEGCVTLRGQLDESLASEILSRARRIEGVAQVRSYLHAPGTPAPNKAEAYAASYSGDGRNGA